MKFAGAYTVFLGILTALITYFLWFEHIIPTFYPFGMGIAFALLVVSALLLSGFRFGVFLAVFLDSTLFGFAFYELLLYVLPFRMQFLLPLALLLFTSLLGLVFLLFSEEIPPPTTIAK